MSHVREQTRLGDELRGARCKGTGRWWSRIEATSAAARSVEGRDEAAAPAMDMCARCPVREACATWARSAHYSGIAGGIVLHEGAPLTLARRRTMELAEAA